MNIETKEMATIRKTITVTHKQDEWIKAQIEKGDYTNESEYIRDLLRKEQEGFANFMATKAAIEEGLNSGVSARSIDEIWKQAEKEISVKNV
ncbi:type II toxin-antitoxin system ParD family antitoxin [Flavimarina sp. Hel_I_48]|uniref:type II toxin-antitoxin system ParD family antitoxin n=1 Tax=Flavimarina sp. Hel_I_48 TaxID=1392488 RepID=UPI001F13E832|nr:type II toxin-antitoxin system ParD family antitoxin [Flavimarina sp. Hel_I_48]